MSPTQSHRPQRVARQIAEVLTRWILTQGHDPRLRSAVVTHVALSADLGVCKVHVLGLGDAVPQAELIEALGAAAAPMRRAVAESVRLRRVPELRFYWDDVEASARAIEKTLAAYEPPEKTP